MFRAIAYLNGDEFDGIAVAAFAFSTLASFLSLFPETMCLKIAGGDGC